MRILIVGSKGFIGSHLVEHFSQKSDFSVFGCDVKEPDTEKNFMKVEKFNTDYEMVFSRHEYDVCIYAGGNGSVPYSLEYPEIDFQLNTYSVNRLLTALKKIQPSCKFIHISSAAVYGTPETLPVNEDFALKPLSPYGYHKLMAELICEKFYSIYGIRTMSMRVFSVYGDGLRKQLFWDIYQKLNAGSEVRLFGTGNESRDFINIRDLMQAFECIIKNASFRGEHINVSSGIETTISDAAHLMIQLYRPAAKLTFSGEHKAGDPINWKADITKLQAMGFRPSVSMEDGLKNYAQWLRERE